MEGNWQSCYLMHWLLRAYQQHFVVLKQNSLMDVIDTDYSDKFIQKAVGILLYFNQICTENSEAKARRDPPPQIFLNFLGY